MSYTTGLLVGRAYALAHHHPGNGNAVDDLVDLAAGDVASVTDAVARLQEFGTRRASTVAELRAMSLLSAARRSMLRRGARAGSS